MARNPKLTQIDLSKAVKTKDGGWTHPDIKCDDRVQYLVLYDGRFYVAVFDMEWFGLNFDGIYDAGAQFLPHDDPSWQGVWRISRK